MGVFAFKRADAAAAAGRTVDPEKEFGDHLRSSLDDIKTPSAIAGIAIGLVYASTPTPPTSCVSC